MDWVCYPHTWDFKYPSRAYTSGGSFALRDGTRQCYKPGQIIDSPLEFGDGSVTVQDVLVRCGRSNRRWYASGEVDTGYRRGFNSKLTHCSTAMLGYFLIYSAHKPAQSGHTGNQYNLGGNYWEEGFYRGLSGSGNQGYIFPLKSRCIGNTGYYFECNRDVTLSTLWVLLFDRLLLNRIDNYYHFTTLEEVSR